MKCRKKLIINISLILLIASLFLIVPTFIYPDSDTYYLTAKILLGLKEFSEWNIVRGPVMAIIQFPFLKIFGTNELSIRLCTCIFYILMLYVSHSLIKEKSDEKTNNKYKLDLAKTLFIIFIVLNPIIYGYYHGFLTEFVAITISVINLAIFRKIEQNGFENNKKYIMYLVYNIFIFIFCWFLKQPYFTIAFFPTIFLIYLNIRDKKNIFKSILFLIIPTIALLLSLSCWRTYTEKKGVVYSDDKNNSHFLSNALIDSNSNYEKVIDPNIYSSEWVESNEILDKNEKKSLLKKLKNNNKNYRIYYIHNLEGDIIDAVIFSYEKEVFTSIEALKFTINAFIDHPIIVIDSYISNYLASINIYSFTVKEDYFRASKEIGNYYGENYTIGLPFLEIVDNNSKWVSENHSELIDMKVEYSPNRVIISIIKIISVIHLQLYKILYLLLPLLWIYLFIKTLQKKKEYNYAFIMISFVFFHTLFHVITGAIIDRYIYISYPIYIIAIINLYKIRKKCSKNAKK